MPERKLPKRLGIFLFSFFALLGPLELITVRHFPKKSGNTEMLRSGKNTVKRNI